MDDGNFSQTEIIEVYLLDSSQLCYCYFNQIWTEKLEGVTAPLTLGFVEACQRLL